MIPREILKKVRRLEITTRGLVNDVFSGEYHSVFKGRGMDFAEVREYQHGDDIRSIDWNVTARAGAPYVKVLEEERELSVVFVMDISGSEDFGTRDRRKTEIAAEICALLAFSAIKNNDKVGLLTFSDRVELFVPPRKGRRHVLRVLRELLYARPTGRGTDIGGALEHLTRVVRRRSVVFLVSDFLGQDYQRALAIAGRRHDLIAVHLTDPRETALPTLGLVAFEDAETGHRLVVDTSDPVFQRGFAAQSAARRDALVGAFRRAKVDVVDVVAGQSYVEALILFFRQRALRFR